MKKLLIALVVFAALGVNSSASASMTAAETQYVANYYGLSYAYVASFDFPDLATAMDCIGGGDTWP